MDRKLPQTSSLRPRQAMTTSTASVARFSPSHWARVSFGAVASGCVTCPTSGFWLLASDFGPSIIVPVHATPEWKRTGLAALLYAALTGLFAYPLPLHL